MMLTLRAIGSAFPARGTGFVLRRNYQLFTAAHSIDGFRVDHREFVFFVLRIEFHELVSVAVVGDGIIDGQDDEGMNVRCA